MRRRLRAVAGPALLAAATFAAIHAVDGDVGLDLADEGFLWHGVERTARGDVPLRDFQAAYEPGRYYWGAAFFRARGEGLLSLRSASAAFAAVGLCFGLLCARRISPHPLFLLACAPLLALWMAPRHKVFEPSLALLAVWAGTRLLERPVPGRFFAAGAAVGVAACFGRNLALYNGLGLLLVALFAEVVLRPPERRRRLFAWVAGGLAGAGPLLAMLALVPGLSRRYVDNVLFYVERGVNHPLPVPWPWQLPPGSLGNLEGLGTLAIGLGFVAMAVGYPLGLWAAARTRQPPDPARALVITATLVGVCFAHHASVRSDASHLAQSIAPLLLLWLALPAAFDLRPLVGTAAVWLLVWTGLALPEVRPTFARLIPGVIAPELVALRVGADRIRVPAAEAARMRALQRAVESHVPPGEPLFVAPAWPGLHPFLGRPAPLWEVYFLWPARPAEERSLVERLDASRVAWALLQTGAPFDIEALRFDRSHPILSRHLDTGFRPVGAPRPPSGLRLLRRRTAGLERPDAAAPGPPASTRPGALPAGDGQGAASAPDPSYGG